MQLNNHRLVSSLQSAIRILFIRDNCQQLLAARLQLIFSKFAALIGQRGLRLLRALFVRSDSFLKGEATLTGELQNLLSLLLIRDHSSQVLTGLFTSIDSLCNQFFNFTTDRF